jgi:hypothetical protein
MALSTRPGNLVEAKAPFKTELGSKAHGIPMTPLGGLPQLRVVLRPQRVDRG